MKAKIALVIAAAALSAAVLIPVGLAGASKADRASVGVAQSSFGRVLVDGRGYSIYLFEKDALGKSSCYGACATAWPPLIAAGKPRAKSGVKAAWLGRTKRKDGRWQVTYKRHPLYTFVKDSMKGQTNGEGVDAFGAEWYLVSPAGAKVAKDGAASSSGNDPSRPRPARWRWRPGPSTARRARVCSRARAAAARGPLTSRPEPRHCPAS